MLLANKKRSSFKILKKKKRKALTMKKTKICHIGVAYKRYDKRLLTKECVSLYNAGYDVTLLVADGKESEIVDGVKIKSVDISNGSWWIGPGEWMIDGKKVKSKEVSLMNRISRELNTYKYVLNDAMATEGELYHLHDPILLPLGAKLKSLGKKVIFDSHENHPEQMRSNNSIPIYLRKLVALTYKKYETEKVKKFDAVIAPCTFSNGIEIFKGRSKRTEIISNAPKLTDFYDVYDYQRSIVDSSETTVCYTGGLTHQRGITHLIKAAYKARVKLSLAGTYEPINYKEQLEKMSEYSCVDYRGYLNYSDLVKLYKQAKIGAVTLLNVGQYNTADNFATKVYEYMSMGLPVVISKSDYTDKILKKYKFGIAVDPGNIDEIADAIRYIIENPDVAKLMGENGRRAVLEKFNWSIEEKKLIKLYEEILN